jgi:uncharacterized membrane protein YfcA
MIGVPLPQAVMVVMIAAAIQSLLGVVRLRSEVRWWQFTRPALIRIAALPVGVCLLWFSQSLDPVQIKQMVGLVLLVALSLQLLVRVEPAARLHPAWEFLAFTGSGLLLGLCGMGGPPMVLWVMAHDWSSRKSRAFLFFLAVSGMLPHWLILYCFFGQSIMWAGLFGFALLPVVFGGAELGLRIGNRLPRQGLRRLTIAVLFLVAGGAIVSPWLSTAPNASDGPSEAASPAPPQLAERDSRGGESRNVSPAMDSLFRLSR